MKWKRRSSGLGSSESRGGCWNQGSVPRGRIPRLALTNDLFHVGGEARIKNRRFPRFFLMLSSQGDGVGDGAAGQHWRMHDCQEVVPSCTFDEDFRARPHMGQHRRKIGCCFQFRDVNNWTTHTCILSSSPALASRLMTLVTHLSPSESYSLARSMLITSSAVITPVKRPSSSITGRVSRLYLSKVAATVFSSAPGWIVVM
jgi:hypothetical protein